MSAPRAGRDRWLLSYADLVTLLFAFFTVLYASSTMDASRAKAVSDSVSHAFTSGEATGPRPVPVVAPVHVVPTAFEQWKERLTGTLATAIADGRVELTEDARGVVLSFPEQATFAAGSADLAPAAASLIASIAAALVSIPNPIRVEGHTDDRPISTDRFRSNFELSTARASTVIGLLVTRVGLAPARLSAAGYGEFHPRVPNLSDANRARNRRIDLVVLR